MFAEVPGESAPVVGTAVALSSSEEQVENDSADLAAWTHKTVNHASSFTFFTRFMGAAWTI